MNRKLKLFALLAVIAVVLSMFATQSRASAAGDLTITGVVSQYSVPVPNAQVTFYGCNGVQYTTSTNASGQYSKLLPGAALTGCTSITGTASANRSSYMGSRTVASLYASPIWCMTLYNYRGE